MKQNSLIKRLLKTSAIGGAFCLATITATAEPYFPPFAPNGTHIQFQKAITMFRCWCEMAIRAKI